MLTEMFLISFRYRENVNCCSLFMTPFTTHLLHLQNFFTISEEFSYSEEDRKGRKSLSDYNALKMSLQDDREGIRDERFQLFLQRVSRTMQSPGDKRYFTLFGANPEVFFYLLFLSFCFPNN